MISLRIYTWNNIVDKYNYEIRNNENRIYKYYNIDVSKICQGKYAITIYYYHIIFNQK